MFKPQLIFKLNCFFYIHLCIRPFPVPSADFTKTDCQRGAARSFEISNTLTNLVKEPTFPLLTPWICFPLSTASPISLLFHHLSLLNQLEWRCVCFSSSDSSKICLHVTVVFQTEDEWYPAFYTETQTRSVTRQNKWKIKHTKKCPILTTSNNSSDLLQA